MTSRTAIGVSALIATELHQLRRAQVAATVHTRGGKTHGHGHDQAAHHHTVLTRARQQTGVLLPLMFAESSTRSAVLSQPAVIPSRKEICR
ncbi:hypothetical protein IU450_36290 [Nocardia abscessus]|uniref:hypothetical protein n=1 Tax=Nocardia abscessus TaxID=120957 RepID=UPI0018943AD9|nr:hypothetical protein [Nocardia abscessus]MBF6341303.1 hypothetical protein [Nocardia abscessus]